PSRYKARSSIFPRIFAQRHGARPRERERRDVMSVQTNTALNNPVDYGTPRRTSEKLVSLEIDGFEVSVPEGTSVMAAAMQAGIKVPKLCATDSLEPFGSCRLCLVEIEGRKGYPASCTTNVAPGMKVRTQTPRLADLRRNVMEL